jgi:para-nitrobenzyl esterase
LGDVVVVGVNYRLGPLGFLDHPGLGDGMMGLRDIVAALQFVRTHIAAFGGDPGCVTLMGQSAGGAAILRLLVMDETEGLFHRAIVQSGPPRPSITRDVATTRARRLMELVGIDPDAGDAADRLRAAPAQDLVTLQMQIARENARFAAPDPAFPPVFDDFNSVEDFSARLARSVAGRGIDIVLGTVREEMHAFLLADPAMENPDPAKVAERFATLAGSSDAMGAYRRRRPGGDLRGLLAELITDHRFLFPTLTLAEHLADAGCAGFLYQFDWSAKDSPWRACHCIELPFVFGTRAHWDAPMLAGANEAECEALSRTMMLAWTQFARAGTPEQPDLVWPRYERTMRRTMAFGSVTGVVGDLGGAGRRG